MPRFEENATEAMVLFQPIPLPVSSPSLFLALKVRKPQAIDGVIGPFPAAVEEIAQKEYCVWKQDIIYALEGFSYVQIGVLNREGGEWPWSAGISMWIYELRIGNEDDVMWACTYWLCRRLANTCEKKECSNISEKSVPYPSLPLFPGAILYFIGERLFFAQVKEQNPCDHQEEPGIEHVSWP